MDVTRTFGAFVRRDWLTVRSYRVSWVMSLWASVFQLLMFYFISETLDAPEIELVSGETVQYFAFVMVGLALYSLINQGITTFSSSLRLEQTSGTLEVLFTMPTSPSLTMLGLASYGIIYALISTALFLAAAIALFGLRPALGVTPLLGTLIALIASILLFASLGVLIAAFTLVFKRGLALAGVVTQVLALLSGVYFPVANLPRPLQVLAEAIPLTWALTVLRQTVLTGEVPAGRIAFLSAFTAVTIPFALWVFDRAVRRARRDGSLSQY